MDDREDRWTSAMRAARRGHSTAYADLLREIAEMLQGLTRARLIRLGLDAQEAEDVVQETLIALHQKRDTWDERRPILPWIYAIARYKLLDAVRSLSRARRRTDGASLEDFADLECASIEASARDILDGDVERLVASLPRRERGVVAALGLEGLSVAATAARFALSEVAVRVAFHRGLARLSRMANASMSGD